MANLTLSENSLPGFFLGHGKTWETLSHLLLLFFILWAAYANMFSNYFLSDDFNLLQGSSNWLDPMEGFFRPIPHLLIYLLFKLSGTTVAPYHILSFLMHFANTTLVYLLIKKMIGSPYFALTGSVLLGVNFLISETVFWISSVTTLAVTLFYLAGLLIYLHYLDRPKRSTYALIVLSYIMALLSKENAVTFPFMLLAADLCRNYVKEKKFPLLQAFKRTLPFFLLTVAYLGVKAHSLGAAVARDSLSFGYHNYRNVRHLLLSFFTFNPFYDLPFLFVDIAIINLFFKSPVAQLNIPINLKEFYLPLLIGAAILVFCFYLLIKGHPKVKFALVAFFISLGPFIFIGSHHKTFGGYFLYPLRLYYLPAAFFFIFLATLLYRGTDIGSKRVNSKRLILLPLVLLVIVLSVSDVFKTRRRNHDWKMAGEIAHSYVAQIGPFIKHSGKGKKVVLFNLPDNIRGVYIFRNGIRAAIDLAYPQDLPAIGVSTAQPEEYLANRGREILEEKILLDFRDGKITPIL